MTLDPLAFFSVSTLNLAKDLLGATITRSFPEGDIVKVRIIETEAYHETNDPASHSLMGKTERNAPMFGPPGRLYVYFIYGVHHCFNVVTEKEGVGAAVLIRAAQPITGLSRIQANRIGCRSHSQLLNGPGKLAQALQIDRQFNNHRLWEAPIVIEKGSIRPEETISQTPRIGISKGKDKLWRFALS